MSALDPREPVRVLQYVHRCLNDFGVSVIHQNGSAGTSFEVAVVWFHGPGDDDWEIVYDTPVTDDVIPHRDPDEVTEIIERVARLPRRLRALEG